MISQSEHDAPILIVTPDYLPNESGLTTFTLNLERALKRMGAQYKTFHWRTGKDLKGLDQRDYPIVFHTQFNSTFYYRNSKSKHIVFCHQDEKNKVLRQTFSFLTPVLKPFVMRSLKKSHHIIFSSAYSYDSFFSNESQRDYLRDWIFKPTIQDQGVRKVKKERKSLNDETLYFYCPHKVTKEIILFLNSYYEKYGKKLHLYALGGHEKAEAFSFSSIEEKSREEREEILSKCHFSLLFNVYHLVSEDLFKSLQYSVPLITSVHDLYAELNIPNKTGWQLTPKSSTFDAFFNYLNNDSYCALVKNLEDYHRLTFNDDKLDQLLHPFVKKYLNSSSAKGLR